MYQMTSFYLVNKPTHCFLNCSELVLRPLHLEQKLFNGADWIFKGQVITS